jgi:iron complex outermembrane receptor protein
MQEWLSQTPPPPQAPVQVTGIRLNPTDAGLEIVLQTASPTQLQAVRSVEDKTLTIEIPNVILALPNQQPFQTETATETVTATQLEGNRIQVQVVGKTALPTATVIAQPSPVSEQSDDEQEEELVVQGNRAPTYRVPSGTTATRTDTPLRDIPQSIQVIPRQVLDDQNVVRISDAARNVSGVTPLVGYGGTANNYTIRGFEALRQLRNGFTDAESGASYNVANIERVEVLKGPASVLYGQFEPGGVVNYVTKQPLREPYYAAEFSAGSYSFYRPSLDVSGPLTTDKKLLYRLNVAYEDAGSFRDFVYSRTFLIAPVLTYNFSEKTSLTLEFEYQNIEQNFDRGIGYALRFQDLPISRNSGEPDDRFPAKTLRGGYVFNHRFNENLSLRNAFYVDSFKADRDNVQPRNFQFEEDGRTVRRVYTRVPQYNDTYALQTDLIGKFKTGSVAHQVLFGVEVSEANNSYRFQREPYASLDLFNPIYRAAPLPTTFTNTNTDTNIDVDTVGIYLQDQITLLPNLKLLIGGRYDTVRYKGRDEDFLDNGAVTLTERQDNAFSPRVGLVYQPIPPISLYASYSRSFKPNNFALDIDRNPLEPEKGTQFEVGVKGELLNGRLSATLAAYNITKQNVATPDPRDPDIASIAMGEVKSRGIELDIAGQLAPGWNVIASYGFNNAFVSQSNDPDSVNDRLINAAKHTASLWTTYEIQTGRLKGLGVGAGIFLIGDREAELPNDIEIPGYVRTDATVFYRRDNWRAALNFKNLFSVTYYDYQGNLVYPGAPLTVIGSLSVQF